MMLLDIMRKQMGVATAMAASSKVFYSIHCSLSELMFSDYFLFHDFCCLFVTLFFLHADISSTD